MITEFRVSALNWVFILLKLGDILAIKELCLTQLNDLRLIMLCYALILLHAFKTIFYSAVWTPPFLLLLSNKSIQGEFIMTYTCFYSPFLSYKRQLALHSMFILYSSFCILFLVFSFVSSTCYNFLKLSLKLESVHLELCIKHQAKKHGPW